MQIAANSVAIFQYTLKNGQGEVLDSSAGGEGLTYLHGAGNIVAGLENAMLGRAAGESFEVSVAPEDGYGVRDESLVQSVPRNAFPAQQSLEVGMQFQAQTPYGARLVTISAVGPAEVTVDANHPLAGATLNFAIRIESVRAASAEELAHGHVHGPGGHHH